MRVEIGFRLLPHRPPGLPLPAYHSEGAAGMDLPAAAAVELGPLDRALVPTGLALWIPEGYEVQVRPRSGLALRHGVTVLNAPGTIDSDYRGELQVLLVNLGSTPYTVQVGERIAQMVLSPVVRARLVEVPELPPSDRGTQGFGSSGGFGGA